MKKMSFYLLFMLCIGMQVQPAKSEIRPTDQQRRLIRTKTMIQSDSSYLQHIDSLYHEYNITQDKTIQNTLQTYYLSIEPTQRQRIDSLLLNNIERSFISQNDDTALFEAFKYLNTTPENNSSRGIVLYACGQIYLARSNWSLLYEVIKELERFRERTGIDMALEINELNQCYETASNYIPLEKDIVGLWVSNLCDNRRTKTPELVLRVNNPQVANGASLFRGNSFYKRKKNSQPDINSESQEFNLNGLTEHVEINFFNHKMNLGSQSTAQAFFETAQNIQAQTAASIAGSNVNFKNTMLATGGGILASTLLIFAGEAASMSSATTSILKISATRTQPGILNGNYSYHAYYARANGTTKDLGGWDSSVQLMKIDPNDGIVFSSRGGYPLGENMDKNNPHTAELYHLNRRYKFYQPQYLGSMIAGMGLGIGFIINGINQITKKDDVVGTPKVICGAYFTIAVPFIVNAFRKHFKRKAIGRYNEACYERLYKKYNTTVSVTPAYESDTNAIGMDISYKF